MMAYATANKQEAMEFIKKNLPDEYAEMLKEHEAAQKESFRLAVTVTAETVIFISGAVVVLMFSVSACYIVLAAGIVSVILTNIFEKSRLKRKNKQ